MGKENKSKVDKWLTEDSLILLAAWRRDGLTIEQIADKIGVDKQVLFGWKYKYEEIEEALSKGKEIVDYKVENALLKCALGFKTVETETYISKPRKDGTRTTSVKRIEKEVAPSVTACLAWLNNRKPDKWKRNRDNDTITDNKDSNITINIVKKTDDDFEVEAEQTD